MSKLEIIDFSKKPDPVTAIPRHASMTIDCGIIECPYGGGRMGYGRNEHAHYTFEDYNFAVLFNEQILDNYEGPVFKWLSQDLKSTHGGLPTKWELPKRGKSAPWVEPDTHVLSTCQHGLHGLLPGQRGFGGSGRLFLAEVRGPIMLSGYSKIVAMNMRLVREVDYKSVVTPEMQLAYWRRMRPEYTQPGHAPYGYPIPRAFRPLLKDTPEATHRAARRAAAPFMRDLRAARKDMAPYTRQQAEFTTLFPEQLKYRTPEDWKPYYEADKRAGAAKRKLRQLERIAHLANTKPQWSELDPKDITNPDVALYLRKEQTIDPTWLKESE
jgi:hypothetical protein